MKITVTQDDIKNGQKDNACYCPVALAINRAFKLDPKEEKVTVSAMFLTFYTIGLVGYQLKSPIDVWRFVRAFDCQIEGKIAPFTFFLPYDEFPKY